MKFKYFVKVLLFAIVPAMLLSCSQHRGENAAHGKAIEKAVLTKSDSTLIETQAYTHARRVLETQQPGMREQLLLEIKGYEYRMREQGFIASANLYIATVRKALSSNDKN